jgi:hypothetical protein
MRRQARRAAARERAMEVRIVAHRAGLAVVAESRAAHFSPSDFTNNANYDVAGSDNAGNRDASDNRASGNPIPALLSAPDGRGI